MDRIPPIKTDRNKAVEHAARVKDVVDRANAARPVDTGRDVIGRAILPGGPLR